MMSTPTPAAMTAYVKKLPPIYRQILKAFPKIEPARKAGFGLAFHTLAAHFANERRKRLNEYALAEVQEACRRLADMGFVEIKNEIFVHPTELGEQLIAAATGREPAPQMSVPDLPPPTW